MLSNIGNVFLFFAMGGDLPYNTKNERMERKINERTEIMLIFVRVYKRIYYIYYNMLMRFNLLLPFVTLQFPFLGKCNVMGKSRKLNDIIR